jgi:hypothetical protein
VHVVGFIIRIYYDARSAAHQETVYKVTAVLSLQCTVHVTLYKVTAVLSLQYTVHVMLYKVTAVLSLQYTVHVTLYKVTAVLSLQYTVHVMLFPTISDSHLYIITFRSMCAVSIVAVFCSSLTTCFSGSF